MTDTPRQLMERALRYAVEQYDLYANSVSMELEPVDYFEFVAREAQDYMDAVRQAGREA